MLLSVVIPTYNRKEILFKTLSALNEQQGVDVKQMEVLVVDDGSTDGTREWMDRPESASLFDFQLRYFQQEHAGQGNARNLAFDHARGDSILILGDDMIPDPDCVAQHLIVHQTYPATEVACLGFTTWHPDIRVTPFMYFLEHGGPQFNYPALEKKPIVDQRLGLKEASFWFFYTGNISLKKKILEGKRFEPLYTSYGWEDIDFGYTLFKERRLKIYYNAKASTRHWHEISPDSFEQRMVSIGKNALIFDRRYPEVDVLPHGAKKIIFHILSWRVVILIFLFLSKIIIQCSWFYYYALSKRYFLKGIKGV